MHTTSFLSAVSLCGLLGLATLARTQPAPNLLDGVIGSRGGIPLIEGGKVIGAIGCSGGSGTTCPA